MVGRSIVANEPWGRLSLWVACLLGHYLREFNVSRLGVMKITRRTLLNVGIETAMLARAARPALAAAEGTAAAGQQSGQRTPLVPLLWTQGQPEATIRRAVREVASSGNTGFVWESRPHPNYLEDRWWTDLGAAIDEAQKLGLEVWIFDEWMYPSGVAGGKVVQNNPAFALHTVEDRSIALDGPASAGEWDIPKPLEIGERLFRVAAVRANADPVDVTPKDGSTRVRWTKPDGRWRIVWSVVRVHAPDSGWKTKNMIDVMNPASTAEFLRLTHEETFRHFGPHFGKTIKGFFSDETGFRNITSYESLPGTPGMPMPWSPVLLDTFRKWKDYDLAPWLPALWYDLGSRSRQVRHDFVDVCSRAFAEHFFKPQQDWCRAHGVRLIGHLVEDNHADHNLGYGPGHWFRSMRYFDMPGIDIVGYQVTPGVDAGEVPWKIGSAAEWDRGWDQEHFQFGLPAMARGAALMQGTREILSEAFGAYGWSLGLRMQKWIGDWHIVNGIGVLSPHAFTMKYHDGDCPQHFNRMSGNPQWRYYAQWAQPFSRMQRILSATDAVYDAAVLYTAESAWVGPAQNVAPAVRTLETNQISTVVLPYEALAQKLEIRDGAWWINRRALRSVVLPYVRFLPGYAAERLVELADAGVRVIVLEKWPEASADARSDEAVRSAITRLKASPNAVLTTTQEIPAHVQSRNLEAASAVPALTTALRSGKEEHWLLLHNRSLTGPISTRVLLRDAPAHAALLDAMTGQYLSIPYQRVGSRLQIDIQIPPYALWALRLTDRAPKAGRMPVFRSSQPVSAKWETSRAVDDSGDKFEQLGVRAKLEDWRRWSNMDSYAGTVRYRTTIDLKDIRGTIGLDAGRVEEVAELTVNGKHMGAKIHPPYVWDISSAVHTGSNEIIIDVTNTALARWRDGFSHGDAASGLMGPIRIVQSA